MSEEKQDEERDIDFVCTAVGAVVLLGLVVVWAIATWQGMQLTWKVLAVPGGIGLALMLPFSHLERLLELVTDSIPFLGGGDT